MSHGVGKAMESLRWALVSGPDDGDQAFKDRREGMVKATEASDVEALLKWSDLMFTDDHRDEHENLKAFAEEDPDALIRLAREFLNLSTEPKREQ